MTADKRPPGITLVASEDVRSRARALVSPHVNVAVNGKYMLEQRLGGGGMAEVFLARTVGAEGFSRRVAIKRVLAGYSDNPEFARLFVSEAQLTSRLQHSNVVSVLDFDRDTDGRLFLVMELVNGTDLDGLLSTGPLPVSLVIYLAIEILRGLDYAHDLPLDADGVRGIVHRDISPHNVLLGWDGAVKVSDFGIAKARAATSATGSSIIKGKPAYMSPEQARGLALDGRSDVFAVGVMLFEMLCLRPLFAGNTTEETLSRLFFDAIPTPREVRPDLPADLSRVVATLLQREPDARPTANAAIAALSACSDRPPDGRDELITVLSQRFVGRAPVRSREIARSSPVAPTIRHLRHAVTATAPGRVRSTPHRSRMRWVLLASFLALGGIVAILVGVRSANPNEATPPTSVQSTPANAPGSAGAAAPAAVSAPRSAGPTTPPMPPAPAERAPAAPGSGEPPTPPKGSGKRAPEDGRTPGRSAPSRPTGPSQRDGIQEIHL